MVCENVEMYTMYAYVRYRYADSECLCVVSFPRLILSNPLLSSSAPVNMYIYDESSAPTVRASGAHGRKSLI